jgi:hypothetical protein
MTCFPGIKSLIVLSPVSNISSFMTLFLIVVHDKKTKK